MDHRHFHHPPPSLPTNSNHPSPPASSSSGYHMISLPFLRRCVSDPYNPPSAAADHSLSASICGGSLTPQCSPDRHNCPKTPPSNSPTMVRPPLPPPHTLRRSVSDLNPSPAKVSSRFSTTSQDLGDDIGTPNSKRLRRMKERLRDMSQWCQQLMRDEDLMEEDDQAAGATDQEDQVEEEEEEEHQDDQAAGGATDEDFPNDSAPTEDEYGEKVDFAESVSVEKKDDCLVVHFRCHCDKAYQFLLSGGECYYKLM